MACRAASSAFRWSGVQGDAFSRHPRPRVRLPARRARFRQDFRGLRVRSDARLENPGTAPHRSGSARSRQGSRGVRVRSASGKARHRAAWGALAWSAFRRRNARHGHGRAAIAQQRLERVPPSRTRAGPRSPLRRLAAARAGARPMLTEMLLEGKAGDQPATAGYVVIGINTREPTRDHRKRAPPWRGRRVKVRSPCRGMMAAVHAILGIPAAAPQKSRPQGARAGGIGKEEPASPPWRRDRSRASRCGHVESQTDLDVA